MFLLFCAAGIPRFFPGVSLDLSRRLPRALKDILGVPREVRHGIGIFVLVLAIILRVCVSFMTLSFHSVAKPVTQPLKSYLLITPLGQSCFSLYPGVAVIMQHWF